MEQDSAKIIEKNGKWLVDYNRSGMPLLEIITEAQFTNPEDCKLVVREMQEMLSTLGVSEASIEQGSMRVDVNLSVYDTTSSDVDQNKNVGNSALTHHRSSYFKLIRSTKHRSYERGLSCLCKSENNVFLNTAQRDDFKIE